MGQMMGRENLTDTLNSDHRCRTQQGKCRDNACQSLGFAVAVRVPFICGRNSDS